MVKNIIFDFGDIFINLDKESVFREIENYGGDTKPTPELFALGELYEVGGLTTEEFIRQLAAIFPKKSAEDIVAIWNSILLDFPDYRLKFIEDLAKENKYRLFLLSNTNALHIAHVIKTMGLEKYNRFKNCFEQFYLSHEINLRKPKAEIYDFVLQQNGLFAEETFFIDDTKENIEVAEILGISCWHLLVGTEDIVHLKTKL